jgi:uncharacterized membrane protein YhaH (DUF805 family)
MLFVLDYWYVWIIGLIVLPVIAVLPQLKNIHRITDCKDKDPKEIVKLFLNPGTLAITIMGGVGTFICFVFFLLSILFAIIKYIKA